MRSGREKAWKWAALLLAAGAAAAGGWAWAMQGELTTARYEVPLPVGLEGLDGVKIAQISDVHSADLEGPLRAALEEAAPDLIVMTGDLVNREDRDLSRALSLARMAAETAPAFLPRATMRWTTPAGRSCGTGWRRPACRCWRTGRSCGASGGRRST